MRLPRLSVMTLSALLVCLAMQAATPGSASGQVGSNSFGMKLVHLPAGEFLMGGTEPVEQVVKAFASYHRDEEDFADEYPQHRVRISRPFFLGKHEVTVGQFRRFVEETNYRTDAERDGEGGWGFNPATGQCSGRHPEYHWRNPGFAQTEEHPVVNVSWNDAQAFCTWLSHKEGTRYRLPTEAEWEYACRAGTTTRYWHGDDPHDLSKIARLIDLVSHPTFRHVEDLTFKAGDTRAFTAPVGSFPANRWGLHDMLGNVWEWCADWHADDYYAQSPVDDPLGPGDGDVRIRRGGAWNSFPPWARCSYRNWNAPKTRCLNLGFRVARD